MTQTICYRNWMKSDAANAIFAALGGNARFVGGAVRDAQLGIDAKDIDIATPFHPDEVTSRLTKSGIRVVPTGIKHGTVTAIVSGGAFEITTLRRDVDCTGRHAEVEFTDDWQEDAARRDFTINAMYCNQAGEIFDYFGGIEDLAAGRLRFVGDAGQRCQEDYLRILRFFRFFAYYGRKPVDEPALLACKEYAKGIEGLSGERIQAEMFKLLVSPSAVFSLQLMFSNNVMEFVIPEITEDKISSLERLLEIPATTLPVLRLAVLLVDKLDLAKNVAVRWKLSNADQSRLLFLCAPQNRIAADCSEKSLKKLIRVWGREKFTDICHICFSGGLDKATYDKFISFSGWKVPEFPLAGRDLKAIGLKEGKEMGDALKAAEIWWEESDYLPDKLALLDYVKIHRMH